MVFKFGPAFVVFIVWFPESFWIRDVDGDRQPQFTATFPNAIQLRIVHELKRQVGPASARVLEQGEVRGSSLPDAWNQISGSAWFASERVNNFICLPSRGPARDGLRHQGNFLPNSLADGLVRGRWA